MITLTLLSIGVLATISAVKCGNSKLAFIAGSVSVLVVAVGV